MQLSCPRFDPDSPFDVSRDSFFNVPLMSSPITSSPILISGITGYIGSRLAVDLLNAGYRVRGTMRDARKAEQIRKAIGQHADLNRLEIVSADLLDAESWKPAVEGCSHVMHVASPFFAAEPKNPEDLIQPAVQGTLNVIQAADQAGVKRVVLTSSMAAIVFGLDHNPQEPIDETRWTPVDHKDSNSYIKSKTLAERAAWDYVAAHPSAPELVVINPGLVLGPLLTDSRSDSHLLVQRLLKGDFPGAPKIGYEIVDVRDISRLHQLGMERPEAAGQRFLGVAGLRTVWEVRAVLSEHFPAYKGKMPKFKLPDFAVRLFARWDPEVRGILNELGKERHASSRKAREMLGWTPRSPEEAITATAEDLIARKMI